MTYLNELRKHIRATIAKHPQHTNEIEELYELAVSEIEDGESEVHECELAIGSINELVEHVEGEA